MHRARHMGTRGAGGTDTTENDVRKCSPRLSLWGFDPGLGWVGPWLWAGVTHWMDSADTL